MNCCKKGERTRFRGYKKDVVWILLFLLLSLPLVSISGVAYSSVAISGNEGSCGSSSGVGGCGSNSGGCGSKSGGCGGSSGCATGSSSCGSKSGGCGSGSSFGGVSVVSEPSLGCGGSISSDYVSTGSQCYESKVGTGWHGAATGCGPPNTDGASVSDSCVSSESSASSFPTASVDIDIRVSNSAPRAGDKVDLVLTVKALQKYSNASLEVVLPKEVEYVLGDLTWEGSLAKDEEKVLTATVQVLADGVWEIFGKMVASEGDADRIGKQTHVYLLVGGEASQQYEDMMAALSNPKLDVIEVANPIVTNVSITPADHSGETVTIRGYFGVYECRCDPTDDNNCPCSPCTGNSCAAGSRHLHGIPYMLVEAWDDNWFGDSKIGSTYTDWTGYYSLTLNNDETGIWPEGGSADWYLKFILLGWPWFQTIGDDGYVWVQSMDVSKDWHNAYYGTWTIGEIPDWSDYYVGWIVFTDSRKANILYAAMKACDWMYWHAYGWDMATVAIFYPGDSSYTYPSSYEIYIAGPGKSSLDHAMDDDVVIHEYGHDVMYFYYGTMPRSSCSSATEGCAVCTCTNHGGSSNHCSCDGVSEGWANFFAAIVPEEWFTRNWATDRYVVTKDGLVYRDHESNAYAHEYHEMTFARILWDLVDPTNDGETAQVPFDLGVDFWDYDRNPIWWEMGRQTMGNDHGLQEEPYTLVELWIFWLETFPYGDTTVGESDLCNIYSLHSVTRDFTNRCSNNCKCDGACVACCSCGGTGCPISNYSCNCGGTKGSCSSSTIGCGGAGCGCAGTYCKNAPWSVFPCDEMKKIVTCNCGGLSCTCASATYCKNWSGTYQPCGGTKTVSCGCGGASCTCATATYCKAWSGTHKPCGGTKTLTCSCGGSGCTCSPATYCNNYTGKHQPCGGTKTVTCSCGGTGCTCTAATYCKSWSGTYQPCGGSSSDLCGCFVGKCPHSGTCASVIRCNRAPDPYTPCNNLCGPSFEIWTDKTSYKIGETMKVYVRVRNPGAALPVRALIYLKLPSGALYGPLLDMKVTIPAGYDSGDVLWQSFTIPSAPLGNYAWIAELRNPTTNALIDDDAWPWQLTAALSMEIPSTKVILQAELR